MFAVVLAASLAPLFHYRGERQQVQPVAYALADEDATWEDCEWQ